MRNFGFWILDFGLKRNPYFLASLLAAGFTLSGCSRTPESGANPPASVQPASAPGTKAENTESDTFESALTLTGIVEAGAKAALTARQPAKIIFVGVKSGDTVRNGQTLVLLDDSDTAAQERTAGAGIAAAQAQLQKAIAGQSGQAAKADADIAAAEAGWKQAGIKWEQAKSGLDAARTADSADRKAAAEGVHKAQIGLDRAKEQVRGLEALAKVGGVSQNDLDGARSQAAVAQSDFETAKAQANQGRDTAGTAFRVTAAKQDEAAAQAGYHQAEAGITTAKKAKTAVLRMAAQDVAAARAAVVQARAGYDAARTAQNSFRLTSPLKGSVSDVGARSGETAQPGVPLVTVYSQSGLQAEALATARQLNRIHTGQPAQISADTQPGTLIPAVISSIARSAEPDGRTFRVQFRFQSNFSLRPGQTVRITLAETK